MSKATATDFGSRPCDLCGGGTYTFQSGSIWCPNEDNHPGGHFVVRVAFERAPGHQATPRGRATTPRPVSARTAGSHAEVMRKSSAGQKQKPKQAQDDGFDAGFDAFIGEDAR